MFECSIIRRVCIYHSSSTVVQGGSSHSFIILLSSHLVKAKIHEALLIVDKWVPEVGGLLIGLITPEQYSGVVGSE